MDWERLKLAVGRIHVLSSHTFGRSMIFWHTGRLFSEKEDWTLHVTETSAKPVDFDEKATVWIEGDCFSEVSVGSGAMVHIMGDVGGRILLTGICELVVGGSLRSTARIETNGIAHIFVGEQMCGRIINRESSHICVGGDCSGEIIAGKPSAHLHVQGNFSGTIKPAGEPHLLYLTVEGFAASALLERIAAYGFNDFKASVGSSDKPAGFYPDEDGQRRLGRKGILSQWVVHSQAEPPIRSQT